MKHIFILAAFLFHIVCNAEYVITIPSQPSWDTILSGSNVKIDRQDNNSPHTVYVPNPITFSAQHRSFHHHTPAPQYNLDRMSTTQLAWYFSMHGYTEGDILSHPMLYMNAAYLTLVKQLPRYPEFVEKYYKKYCTYKGLFKFWEKINFRYRSGMKKQFAQLYQECEEQRLAKEARERRDRDERAKRELEAQAIKKAQLREIAVYCAKLDTLDYDELALDAMPYQHQQARYNALAQTKTNVFDRVARKHSVAPDTIIFAREYNISEHDLNTLHGNTYEQQLHTEFLEQLNEAHSIFTDYALQPKNILIDAVGHGVAIGLEANRLQQPGIATAWANFGWKTLEIIKGIGDGLLLCAENTIDMLLHPRHTLEQTVHGLGMIIGLAARTCARTAGTALYWHELMEHGDGLLMAQEMDQVARKVTALGNYCIEKTASLEARDIVKHGTAIAADILLTHKIFVFGGTLCTRATPVIRDAIAHVSNRIAAMGKTIANALEAARAESPVLQTAEGILMKASEELSKVGGVAVEVLSNTRIALETMHAEYMAHLEVELQALRLVCDNKMKGFAEFANKFLKPDYKHILGIENLIWNRKGGLKIIDGFHHDFMNAFRKSGAFEFIDQTMYNHGFYKATVLYEGNIVKNKGTFFPADWSREKVIDKIYEAANNFMKSGVKPTATKDNKYLIKGMIEEGIEIEMRITKNGHVIAAYPVLD